MPLVLRRGFIHWYDVSLKQKRFVVKKQIQASVYIEYGFYLLLGIS
jgi:hypothetical protein